MNDTRKSAQRTTATARTPEGFTDEERGAIKERAKELRASARSGSRAAQAAGEEAAVLARIAEMAPSDRAMAERLHAIFKAGTPELAPRLWYGMPSYARIGALVRQAAR
ncbi:hypothetical protein ACTVZO_34565 [Streptomyces sp. IBSNAI002]|uniref:hypothetical protein n=1 Tax=Streptomyces sp. IBSNAI002 TaxID=3457500 RepID=UPI003FD46995